MKQFTADQIQDKFEQLPQEMQDAVSSQEVRQKIEEIGKKHNLLIDQLGELVDLIGLVMLGLVPAKEFAASLSMEASVSRSEAASIAEDINKEVFGALRAVMQNMEEKEAPVMQSSSATARSISSLERAGGFSVEKEASDEDSDVGPADQKRLLSHLENPTPGRVVMSPKTGEETHTDPIVDHLLANPTSQPEVKVSQTEPSAAPAIPSPAPSDMPRPQASAAPQPTKPADPDPYKEPI